ncbi:hypothetical protein [Paraburkholderia sp. GAS32]|uniref:hypothetical protein n=1 Tax=Paraburkholderia sp. GAS32 TaxID=3035129 RepID=UPI003D1A5CEA
MADDQQADRTETALRTLRNNKLVAVVLIAGMTIVALANFSDSVDKLLVALKLRPDALSLAREGQRDDVSRQLTAQAWRRFFWARAYLARVSRGAAVPESEQDEAWHKYIEASADWSSNVMIYILAVDKFYGHAKSVELENVLQPCLGTMADKLVVVRYPSANLNGDQQQANIAAASAAIDAANGGFYTFVSGFQPPKAGNGTDRSVYATDCELDGKSARAGLAGRTGKQR